ncbi:16S rRNA (guanine(966)-N(2))-methyltransferase RsmD [Vibrio viridaestus]|uniref:Ribosomal RNA small subunit methyltransferase D n=1 Tax=Vibrio viridaestus TaxID=2487322 RepID=A0A3N9TBH2_9VIBR|nr:16S rRNA (guanine(966)-N(2))-methyltransferase RsmD [Vibrio viridaestus]RQW61507.1 16S rRNA (guanine(966)-N(2))-methyltransferase RsmD [Vibrio viridaestus]
MVKRRPQNSSKKQSSSGFVRIISGLWRGRKLPVHDVEGLRPTTDRVKETVFNWLAQEIPHSACLDLFSGSGSLGFEAASRQADNVVMIELDKNVANQLKSNANSLKAQNIIVHNIDALSFLEQAPTPFDVVFIDPPFRKGLIEEIIRKLESRGWLTENASIYIESEKEWPTDCIPSHWNLHREKFAGQVAFRLYYRDAE